MSGIFAIIHRDRQLVERKLLQRMTDSLKYLGPDRQEIWLGGYVGLGHTLFRTTDESAKERQPCTLDGKVYITADARIDGRDELISRLQAQGCEVSHDAPDVELILHAYQVWGEDCLQHLLGDFAFILWDENRQLFFCGRDRFGMRRLYYAQVGSALVLCNSLDCLRNYPGVTAKLNEQAVGDFLVFGHYMWLDKSITIFADIQKVPPAHFLICQGENLAIKRYWDIPLEVPLLRYRKEADYIAHFREIFTTAVRDRMRTDKIVISMSGGMDSSSIAATACRIAAEMPNPPQIQAVTAVYDRIHPDRERYYAGLVAEKLGLPIHYFVCDDYQLLAPAVRVAEPIELYAPSLNVNLERQLAALGRVVLKGDSGDSLLYCSPVKLALKEMNPVWLFWQMLRLRLHFGKMPSLGMGLIAKLRKKDYRDSREPSYPYPCWFNPEFETRLQLKERWRSHWYSEPPVLHLRHPEIQKLLLSPDWSWSLEYTSDIDFNPAENRDPFLDLRLIEFVLSLPLLPWLFKKYLLRRAIENDLPPEVCQRPKTPLGMIHQSLLEQPGTEWVDCWEASPNLLPYVNSTRVPPVARGVAAANESYVHLRPLILDLWLQGLQPIRE